MTTPSDPTEPTGPAGLEPPLTPEEEREVASLLADSLGGGVARTPPDVVARLDEVLAGLVAESVAGRSPSGNAAPAERSVPVDGTVVPLETRRRGRRLPRVLLAAAAVVVGGYAVGNLAGNGSLAGGGQAESAAGDAGGAGDSTAGGGESAGSARPQALEPPPSGADEMVFAPTVRRERLAADVRRVVQLFDSTPRLGNVEGEEDDSGLEEPPDCPVPRLTDEQQLYAVRYQGEPAGLVVGPSRAGRVEVTVYSCRTGGVEVARTVPAP